MRSVTLKGLLAHKLRLMLTALAIILGVTFISGTYVLTDTLHNTFTALFSNIYSKIDFQVRGVAQFGKNTPNAVRDPIPQALLASIRGVPGVAAADGTVTGYAQFRSEAVILAVFGAIVGTLMGLALVSALRQQGITDTVVPVSNLVIFLVLAAVLGLLAAAWPARRAARLDVLAAIAAE